MVRAQTPFGCGDPLVRITERPQCVIPGPFSDGPGCFLETAVSGPPVGKSAANPFAGRNSAGKTEHLRMFRTSDPRLINKFAAIAPITRASPSEGDACLPSRCAVFLRRSAAQVSPKNGDASMLADSKARVRLRRPSGPVAEALTAVAGPDSCPPRSSRPLLPSVFPRRSGARAVFRPKDSPGRQRRRSRGKARIRYAPIAPAVPVAVRRLRIVAIGQAGFCMPGTSRKNGFGPYRCETACLPLCWVRSLRPDLSSAIR